VRLLDQGAGVREALELCPSGRVVARYGRAAYVQMGDRLVAFTDATAPRGPLHARLTVLPPAALPVGEGVLVRADVLELGGVELALLRDHWEPPPVDSEALVRNAPLLELGEEPDLVLGADGDRVPLNGAPLLGLVGAWLRAGELARVADALTGKGAGLTPAGDDVLAGIALVTRLVEGVGAQDGMSALLARCETGHIALAYLRWAARGQSIEPAHLLLRAVAAADVAAIGAARAELARFGQSSGRDLAYGIAVALHARAGRVAAPARFHLRTGAEARR
jgi:hypothetical protein